MPSICLENLENLELFYLVLYKKLLFFYNFIILFFIFYFNYFFNYKIFKKKMQENPFQLEKDP